MFGLWKHTHHHWVPYSYPSTVHTTDKDARSTSLIYTEKCWCGKMRTITISPDKAPIIRESEEA